MKSLVDTIGSNSVDAIFNSYLSCNVVHSEISDSDSIMSSGSEASVVKEELRVQKAKKTKRKRNAIDANDKFERRKMQNRRAAQTSREKKKKYVDNLEKRSLELEAENSSLQAQVLRLLKDNALMKTQLSPATLPTPTTVAPYLTQDIPRLPQVLPTSPCLASESAAGGEQRIQSDAQHSSSAKICSTLLHDFVCDEQQPNFLRFDQEQTQTLFSDSTPEFQHLSFIDEANDISYDSLFELPPQSIEGLPRIPSECSLFRSPSDTIGNFGFAF